MDPARAELTAEEILGERELITELTMLLWSADPLLDLVKPDTLGSGLEGKVIGRGATATGRGATLTVLVCPTADWTAEVILGWRVARILAIRSDWERPLVCLKINRLAFGWAIPHEVRLAIPQ